MLSKYLKKTAVALSAATFMFTAASAPAQTQWQMLFYLYDGEFILTGDGSISNFGVVHPDGQYTSLPELPGSGGSVSYGRLEAPSGGGYNFHWEGPPFSASPWSWNFLGKYKFTATPGFSLFALNFGLMTDNGIFLPHTVENLFSGAPNGFIVHKMDPATGNYVTASKGFLGWINGGMTIAAGEGVWLEVTGAEAHTFTFYGHPQSGPFTGFADPLANATDGEYSLIGNTRPAVLQFRDPNAPILDPKTLEVRTGTVVQRFNRTTQAFEVYSLSFLGWIPHAPAIDTGEAFFINQPPQQ